MNLVSDCFSNSGGFCGDGCLVYFFPEGSLNIIADALLMLKRTLWMKENAL